MATPQDVFSVAVHLPSLTVVAICAALWVISYGLNLRQRFRLRHIPGPRPAWLFGNLREVVGCSVPALHKWAQKYGGCYRIFFGRFPQVVISDPDLVKSVAVKQFVHFHDRPRPRLFDEGVNKEIDSLRFDGILMARGKFWAGLRATLDSMFHNLSLQSFVPLMNQAAAALVDGLSAAGDGSQVKIGQLLRGMTMDVVGTTAFGVKFDALQPPGHPVSELIHHCMVMLAPNPSIRPFRMLSIFMPEFSWLWACLVRLFGYGQFKQLRSMTRICASRGYVWGVAESILRAARGDKGRASSAVNGSLNGESCSQKDSGTAQQPPTESTCEAAGGKDGASSRNADHQRCGIEEGSPPSYDLSESEYGLGWEGVTYEYKRKAMCKYTGIAPQDNTLLYRLASAVNKDTQQPLTDAQICAQANTMLLAGYETTSTALTYTLFEVARHPEVQRKMVEEVDRVLGKGGEAGHAQLLDFPYIAAVFQEAMRVHPIVTPIFALARTCTTNVRVGEFDIPSGSTIMLNVYSMHHDPRNFPQPEVFRPERFLPNSEEAKARHPYAYMPFGFGPRKCIGYKFAMQEATLTLAKIFQRFTFSLPADAPPLEYSYGIIMVPKQEVELIVHHRTLE